MGEFAAAPNAGVYALAGRVADVAAATEWFGRNGMPLQRTLHGAPLSHLTVIDGARHWFTEAAL